MATPQHVTGDSPSACAAPSTSLWRPAAVLLVLILSACSLFLTRGRLVLGDEVLTEYTVEQPSLPAMLHFQLTTPISLEPPAFELLDYASARLLGYSSFSLRLPSLLACLALQLLLFLVLRPLADFRAALLAMLLPLVLGVSLYMHLMRPYALLLAASMMALFCWQSASHRPRNRGWALTGMAAAIALAANSQFYGILIVGPIALGEILRSRGERHWRLSTWIALLCGVTAGLSLVLPFYRAVLAYKPHALANSGPWLFAIADTYLSQVLRSTELLGHGSFARKAALTAAVFAGVATLLLASYRTVRRNIAAFLPEWFAFAAILLTPIPIVTYARAGVGIYSPHHAIVAVLGFMTLLMLALEPALRRLSARAFAALLVLGLLAWPLAVLRQMRNTARERATTLRHLQPPAELLSALAQPQTVVYLTAERCIQLADNLPPETLAHLRCLTHQDPGFPHIFLTEEALRLHTRFPLQFASYQEMQQHLLALVVATPQPWESWLPHAIQQDGETMTPSGNGFSGTVYTVEKFVLPSPSGR